MKKLIKILKYSSLVMAIIDLIFMQYLISTNNLDNFTNLLFFLVIFLLEYLIWDLKEKGEVVCNLAIDINELEKKSKVIMIICDEQTEEWVAKHFRDARLKNILTLKNNLEKLKNKKVLFKWRGSK